ncbi:MAG: prephenate dehydrogenase, partial [Mycobacteriales bacterium]
MTTVAVVGLGLIGGSLLRALSTVDSVGYDVDPATRAAAAAAGHRIAPTAQSAAAGADVVVVATPLPAVAAVFGQLAAALGPAAVVTDVASVKVPARSLARSLLPVHRYVGGHPMAGTHQSGWSTGDPRLLQNAGWALCLDEETDLAAWSSVAVLVIGLGARVVPLTSAEHDAAVAKVSHLPHLLAAVLAAGVADDPIALALAAGSFRDGTRVAATRPELTAAMCEANAAALRPVADAAAARLATASRDGVRALLEAGHAARSAFDVAPGRRRVQIAADDSAAL